MSANFLTPGGIFAEGYGFVPKMMMRDKRLSVEAKAIYSYLSSFAGAGMTSFPSVELIIEELGVSEKRFYKHRKTLIELGYISVKQEKSGNKFTKNIYIINASLPYSHFDCTQNESAQNASVQNDGSNSNSLNNINTTTDNEGNSDQSRNNPINQYQEIIDKWNSSGLSPIKVISNQREKLLKARIKEFSLEQVLDAIDVASQSDFLKGRNDKGWVMDFTWFVKPNNFIKVYEGQYANRPQGGVYATNQSSHTDNSLVGRARAKAEASFQAMLDEEAGSSH